ncbi:hypothetical protein VTO42DRAFT_5539 [Malbranchea cinnamomea]
MCGVRRCIEHIQSPHGVNDIWKYLRLCMCVQNRTFDFSLAFKTPFCDTPVEPQFFAYVRDLRFVLLSSLLLGFLDKQTLFIGLNLKVFGQRGTAPSCNIQVPVQDDFPALVIVSPQKGINWVSERDYLS